MMTSKNGRYSMGRYYRLVKCYVYDVKFLIYVLLKPFSYSLPS